LDLAEDELFVDVEDAAMNVDAVSPTQEERV
jgi:hypothetical protein